MMQEIAKMISALIVFIVFFLILIWIGYPIEDVNSIYAKTEHHGFSRG